MRNNIRITTHLMSTLFVVLATGALAPSASALDSSGLGPPDECFQYQLKSVVKFESGKPTSADTSEYSFSVQMTEGSDAAACPDPKPGRYLARINARWDGKAKRAYETIVHQSPAKAKVTEIVASCSTNPWSAKDAPACSVISIKSDRPMLYDADGLREIAGPYPISAYYIGYAGRKYIADKLTWGGGSGDFILPPTTPPQIIADDGMDIDGRFFRRNQDVRATVKRPSDGSPKWYDTNLKSYDVEVQVQNSGASKMSLSWVGKSIVSSVPGGTPLIMLPYARLFDDPESSWGIENFGARGDYRSVRIRARVHDDTIPRPWTSWRSVQVEVPLRMTKAPGLPAPMLSPAEVGGKTGGTLIAPSLPAAGGALKPPGPPPTPAFKQQIKPGQNY